MFVPVFKISRTKIERQMERPQLMKVKLREVGRVNLYLSEILIKWELKRECCGCWDASRENLIPGHSLVAVPGFRMKSELFSLSIQMPLIYFFNSCISQYESSTVARITVARISFNVC